VLLPLLMTPPFIYFSSFFLLHSSGNHHLFEKDFDLFLGRIGKGVQAGDLQGAAKDFATTGNTDSERAVLSLQVVVLLMRGCFRLD
jgi:hypothetical protein